MYDKTHHQLNFVFFRTFISQVASGGQRPTPTPIGKARPHMTSTESITPLPSRSQLPRADIGSARMAEFSVQTKKRALRNKAKRTIAEASY
jgi:hypothetical protein